jgi:monoterpene epsilon-lactone hydrolase
MSKQQQLELDAILRQGQLDLGADVPTLRAAFNDLMAQVPVAADVRQKPTTIGGVDALEVTLGGTDAANVILYFHGGVYVIGSAAASVPLVGDLARRSGARAVTVDYRLAPEHPYPAAVEDAQAAYEGLLGLGLDPGQIALAGETILGKQAVDPILTPAGLRLRVPDYVAGADPSDPEISPVFGDLSGLPPLLIQVGSHEVLLSDALRLAARAATADVPVTLEVIAGVPHVFQGFAGVLDEGDAALDRAAAFLQTQFVAAQPTRAA